MSIFILFIFRNTSEFSFLEIFITLHNVFTLLLYNPAISRRTRGGNEVVEEEEEESLKLERMSLIPGYSNSNTAPLYTVVELSNAFAI